MTPLVLDGALGTQLESIIPRDSPLQIKSHPLWSTQVLIKEPSLIQTIHERYVEHGADVITTSTYQASRATLQRYCDLNDAEITQLWQRAVEIAHKSTLHRARKIYVAASVGPYGGYLANGAEYTGQYPADIGTRQLSQYHLASISYFVSDPRVDLIAIETIPNFKEFKSLIYLMQRMVKAKPFTISLSMSSPDAMADGTPLSKVVAFLDSRLDKSPQLRGALFAIGCNCVNFTWVSQILHNLQGLSKYELPLVTYPNLGFDDYYKESTDYSHLTNLEQWCTLVKQWTSIEGVKLIGGCCSTGPEEIEIVRKIVDESNSQLSQ